jgi:hypothetical protein
MDNYYNIINEILDDIIRNVLFKNNKKIEETEDYIKNIVYNTVDNAVNNIELDNKLLLYTFCVDIKIHSRDTLLTVFKYLIKSLHAHVKNYYLICYSNFLKKGSFHKKYNIEFRKYTKSKSVYKNSWLNMSFNKINVYKQLYDEFKKDFTWIDLDTIITYDISYIKDLSNLFIEVGGDDNYEKILFTNNNSITLPRSRTLQGNLWKINIYLYYDFMETFNELIEMDLILKYDLQDLFSYHYYIKYHGKIKYFNILGLNYKYYCINGLSIWDYSGYGHANIIGLNNLYYDKDGKLRSNYFANKEIHLVSFTFKTLIQLNQSEAFNMLFYKFIK